MKGLTMRITYKQMDVMLKHKDSPYIRCIGFLYLRFYCEPKSMYEFFMPYLDDMEEFSAAIGQKQKTCVPCTPVFLYLTNNRPFAPLPLSAGRLASGATSY
jgi:hypothetical protein